ncbi:MAG: hypothetical protein SCI25_00275 [Desulfuromonadales bacterium]|nr:hypothetical protein [Desulfuromonadales bacterium]
MSDIRLCNQASQQAQSDIRLCKQTQEPTSREIVLCEQPTECPPDAPDFTYEIVGNQMRVLTGQTPLFRVVGAPCGTGQPSDTLAIGQWVALNCRCSSAIIDACGRSTPAAYGDPTNPPPVVSGPDTIGVGSTYIVTDGDPPFTWDAAGAHFTEGTRSIQITSIAEVCSGSVSVSDVCGRTDSMSVTVGGVLTLTGTETPVVGSQYGVSGGKAPYLWSISCGSIDETGQITSLDGCCGSGTVSVSDACGGNAVMDVRFADGQWVFLGWQKTGTLQGQGSCHTMNIEGAPVDCEAFVVTGCASFPSEYVSRAGRCATHRVYEQCDVWSDGVTPIYIRKIYYCRPIEEWQCL